MLLKTQEEARLPPPPHISWQPERPTKKKQLWRRLERGARWWLIGGIPHCLSWVLSLVSAGWEWRLIYTLKLYMEQKESERGAERRKCLEVHKIPLQRRRQYTWVLYASPPASSLAAPWKIRLSLNLAVQITLQKICLNNCCLILIPGVFPTHPFAFFSPLGLLKARGLTPQIIGKNSFCSPRKF